MSLLNATRTIGFAAGGFAAGLAAWSGMALAGPPEHGPPSRPATILNATFDLSHDRPAGCPQIERGWAFSAPAIPEVPFDAATGTPVLRAPAALRASGDERLRLEWQHRFYTEGPAVEVAALGSGRAGTPSLVHVAFAWDF